MQKYCSASNNSLLKTNGPHKPIASGSVIGGVQTPVISETRSTTILDTISVYATAAPIVDTVRPQQEEDSEKQDLK